MREIKFRAWIDDAALCNEDEIINHLDENGEFIPFMQNLEYWYFDEGQTLGDYLANFGKGNVMQYTGLKDKNGVEIYEGDVTEDEKGVRWEAVFERGKYKLIGLGGRFIREDVKILGNVFENPELMEGD